MFVVYGTYRNSDMTEGKGPMVLDKIFESEFDAQFYVNQQEGVMGRKPPEGGWQNMLNSDWQVRPLQVLAHLEDGPEYERRMARERALAKLTAEEAQLLGLT